jgi:hypothetical protein
VKDDIPSFSINDDAFFLAVSALAGVSLRHLHSKRSVAKQSSSHTCHFFSFQICGVSNAIGLRNIAPKSFFCLDWSMHATASTFDRPEQNTAI